MPINFSNLRVPSTTDSMKVTEPDKIFSMLVRSPAYQYLRHVQGQVLDTWHSVRETRDIVLKMNTGSGKTVVGLLILKSCLNEGLGPAAYFTPDKFLAAQVRHAAEELKIETTGDDDIAYLSNRAILVAPIHKLVNGKSRFSSSQGGATPLSAILIDDAHACLNAIKQQYSIRLKSSTPAYKALLSLFRGDLQTQNPAYFKEVEAGEPKDMLVPYWAWRKRQNEVLDVLNRFKTTEEVAWALPLLARSLKNCECFISGTEVSICTQFVDIDRIDGFRDAKRRIYTTATLADESAMITHVGVEPSKSKRVAPRLASDIGDRMIFMPEALKPPVVDEDVRKFFKNIAKEQNVCVIVPSKKKAEEWSDYSNQVLDASNLQTGVQKVRDGHVGLTVLVNKYDGVDLPNDACRVLVLDGLPEYEDPLDAYIGSSLASGHRLLPSQVQRIEQGMGRGIRSSEDYCAVFLFGRSLTRAMALPQSRAHFSAATLAQLDLSFAVVESIQHPTLENIWAEAVTPFLNRDERWITQSRSAVANAKHDWSEGSLADILEARKAFDLSLMGNDLGAASLIQAIVNRECDSRRKGWWLQQLASYTTTADPSEAQQIQIRACENNSSLLRPETFAGRSKPTSATRSQADQLEAFLKKEYGSDATAAKLAYRDIADNLRYVPGMSDSFEATVKDLGLHLGFLSSRPEKETGRGPDNLWTLGAGQFAVIECKSAVETDIVKKEHLDQSAGRRAWFNEQAPGVEPTYVIFHPSEVYSAEASAPSDLRIVNANALDRLRTAIVQFTERLHKMGAEELQRALIDCKLISGTFFREFGVPARKART